jgi:hypothetical protein
MAGTQSISRIGALVYRFSSPSNYLSLQYAKGMTLAQLHRLMNSFLITEPMVSG